MGYFSKETVRLTLPSDETCWVDIKAKLKAGDVRYRDSQTMRAHMTANDQGVTSELQTEFELGAMRAATLERAIVAWNLTDEDDQPVPVRPEWIAELNEQDAAYIYEEINRLNPARSAQEKNA